MVCFVTGGSGFIGANLVHELCLRGHRVKVLLRPGSNTCGLLGADYEPFTGTLEDVEVLKAGLAGCDWCFHVAASYHLWLPDYAAMYRTNVEGTRNVLRAAASAGCRRIVHTSTVGCIGVPLAGSGAHSDETAPLCAGQIRSHYKKSKWQGEQAALEFVREGAPVVIVNPSTPAGARDAKPTPTGKIIVDYLNGRMPALLDTGLNWVHVRDVAVGHILAAERGKVGERYILGHAEGNWTMEQTFAALERISGVRGPRWKVPYAVALAAGWCSEALSRMTGKPPRAPLAGVRMARHKMYYNPAKAVRELGLPQTSPEAGLREAVEWFRGNGYNNQ